MVESTEQVHSSHAGAKCKVFLQSAFLFSLTNTTFYYVTSDETGGVARLGLGGGWVYLAM